MDADVETSQSEPTTMARPQTGGPGAKLYLRIPSADDPRMRKAGLVLDMFPGQGQVILYCEDTKKRLGRTGELHPSMLKEMKELFGEENVVVK